MGTDVDAWIGGWTNRSSAGIGWLANPDQYLTQQELLVKQILSQALDSFTGNLASTRLIRRFASETPELFCNAGLALMAQGKDSPGHRYMTSLLLKQEKLMRIVSDPFRFTRDDATALFRQLLQLSPGLDIALAHCLPDRYRNVRDESFDDNVGERALEILDATSSGRRIVPILSHLVDDPNPRIAAKAILVVGRRVQNVEWAERQIVNQLDPRRRANAIEAIWGIDNAKAKRILWDGTRDDHNRVAGNAAFGLHVVGDQRVHNCISRMAQHNRPNFRWTSAWLMGRVGDPEYLGPLKSLLKDDDPGVKRAALRSMVEIRREQARLQALQAKVDAGNQLGPDQLDRLAEPLVLEDPTRLKARDMIVVSGR